MTSPFDQPSGLPDLGEVRAWIDVPRSDLPDDQLELILDAEVMVQSRFCTIPPGEDLPAPLVQALLRRCARAAAARGLPLGTLPINLTGAGAEYGIGAQGIAGGGGILPRLDAEIERYEAAWRAIPCA
ncbi:MAG: hypothetical protein LBQ06_05905 [Frankiaceae bacterium]|jgi:hypothetical protein|nr:hypothetical protein [Frankiaceae bacterium]